MVTSEFAIRVMVDIKVGGVREGFAQALDRCFSLRVHVLSSVAVLGALRSARRPDARGQVSTRIDPGGGPSPTLHSANRIFLAARPSTADLSGSSTAHRSAPHHASSSRATATEQVN